MASNSPGNYLKSNHGIDGNDGGGGGFFAGAQVGRSNFQSGGASSSQRDGSFLGRDSGYYVNTSDGASTCSSSTTETGDGEAGTLLVLEPKSLRSFTTNDEYLYAMKEDLADWFSCLYQNDDITADTFFQVLETGVLLCKHANKVQEFARQRREKGETLEMRSYFIRSVPEGNVSFKEDVKPGTFKARDNVSNFISWGRQLGIPEVLSFETDDLVLRKNEKSVILCLLEMARVGAKLGMLAPTLVQMEQEIDAELAGEEPKPKMQIKTCDMRSLDERVRDLIGRCTCPVQFPMVKVGEGKYKIGDSQNLIFVRILRNHVMVRVGGGWDTLENYLNKHDPCQCNYRGHRAGAGNPAAHKINVSQQRRASTPGNPALNTPTSPRRMSTTANPTRNRSTSPQTKLRSRSNSPTLVISRYQPVPSVTSPTNPAHGTKGGPRTQSGGVSLAKSQSALNSSSNCKSSPSQQPIRCKSPSPGRLRSPSPLNVSQSARPSVLRTSSSSALLKGKSVGQDSGTSTPRKTGPASLCSDYDEDAGVDNDGYYAEDDEYVGDEASDAGSVSFDERAELQSAIRSSSSSLERVSESEGPTDGGESGKANVSMDKISTMTLSEFKSLLNSALTVPEEQQQQLAGESGARPPGQSQAGGNDPAGRPLNWDSLREKARSVRDSISSSVSSRRPGSTTNGGGPGVVGRRSLPQSPVEDKGRPAFATERPKTPKALRRNVETPNSPVMSRPKTPTSLSRPKTPTSSYRPKTPSSQDKSSTKEEYQMSRPKTPSQFKRDAVAKVAGAISNWVESRNEMDTFGVSSNKPKTPTRAKTPVGSRSAIQSSIDECDNEDDDCVEIAGALANPQMQALASSIRERPDTPSRIPKPCFTPRPSTPKLASALAAELLSDDTYPFTPSVQQSSSHPTRPNTLSAHRPQLLSRSNSNSSSVRSFDETPSSPVSNCSGDRPFTNVSRKLSYQSNNSDTAGGGRSYKDIYAAKRAGSEVRTMPARAVTPGPREKWNLGEAAGGATQTKGRRGSLNTTHQIQKPPAQRPKAMDKELRRTSSTSNLETDQPMMITNEITFSDDEEINELVKNGALQSKASHSDKRPRASSVDARKLRQQTIRPKKEEEVLVIRRDSSGNHGVQVVKKNEVKYDSTPKANVVRRPQSRGPSADRPVPPSTSATTRFRSQTPDPTMFRQKISAIKGSQSKEAESIPKAGDKTINRTEAWVDSTLSDTKRKLPPRPKRVKGYGNEIPASELVPRSLEEIKAMLTEPKNGYTHVDAGTLDPPAEDPEMFKKMEKLFEKYREMELRSSVNDTPGAGEGAVTGGKSADAQSVKAGSQGSGRTGSRSSPSVTSLKTSTGSGVSSSGQAPARGANGIGGVGTPAYEANRFKRSTSVPGSFQNPKLNLSSSNNSSAVSSPCQERKDFPQAASTSYNGQYQESQTARDSDQRGLGDSLKDIDPEVAKNPAALISKIKEILKVRPRKDDASKIPTRIPAPASKINRQSRSKSVSNLFANGDTLTDRDRGQTLDENGLQQADHFQDNSSQNPLRRTSSSSSGNIAYAEYIYTDDPADEVPELTRTSSVQSDSSDSQNRSETPIPKLATPLTTGRSTLISRRGDRMGKSLSQDKDNTLSNSQSSLSSRSVLSATEDDPDFV